MWFWRTAFDDDLRSNIGCWWKWLWLWLGWRRVEWLHWSHDRLHDLRLVHLIRLRASDTDIHVITAAGLVIQRTEQQQAAAKEHHEQHQLAALGLEKIEEVARFHGWPLGE